MSEIHNSMQDKFKTQWHAAQSTGDGRRPSETTIGPSDSLSCDINNTKKLLCIHDWAQEHFMKCVSKTEANEHCSENDNVCGPGCRSELLHLIKSCGREKNVQRGHKIHAASLHTGLLHNDTGINAALISMYAKCGALAKAHEVFNELHVHDVLTWTALITAYVGHGLDFEALNYFQKMQNEGFSPDPFTYSSILKACGRTGSRKIGEEIHIEIKRQGLLERNVVLGTALVDMYAKCGALSEAQNVFDELPVQNVVSWTALIDGYTNHGFGHKALMCFEEMCGEGISPTPVTFVCILKACGSLGLLEKGTELHLEVKKQGILRNNVGLGTALVDLYAKCGAMSKAQEVFDELQYRNNVTWNALLTGYCQHKLGDKALNCFQQMKDEGFCPDAITFASALKACGIMKSIDKGAEIHRDIEKQGLLGTDTVLGTALVDMYAKCGELEKARDVLDGLLVKDVISWNALIAGYANHGCAFEALSCYGRMQHEGLHPNTTTFICILNACSIMGLIENGEEVHTKISEQRMLEGDVALGTALVNMYTKCGMLEKAVKVFDNLPKRNVISWTALISGYVQHGRSYEALKCFKRMKDEGFVPDSFTFACILKACGNIGSFGKGKEIHNEVKKLLLSDEDVVLSTALMDMYINCGTLKEPQALFDSLPMRDIVSWNVMIAGYTQHGLCDEALNCFEKMQKEGFSPNEVTFTCILKACGILGSIEKGELVHNQIKRQGFLEESIVLRNALVDMYARCGTLEKAQNVFDGLPIRDVGSWNTLIAGYLNNGFVCEALNCCKQMEEEGINPNVTTFMYGLKACGSIGSVEKGEQIHAKVKGELLESNINLSNALLEMYTKCDTIMKAQSFFDEIPTRNAISWNTLIAGYAQHGLGNEALLCFTKMLDESFCPNFLTYMSVLKACGKIGSIEKGELIHSQIRQQCLLDNTVMLSTALIDMYVKCGSLTKAQEVFNCLAVRDVVAWNTLIAGYMHHGFGDEALNCFQRMQDEGFVPDVITFHCVLKACGSVGCIELGEEIHDQVKKQGLLKTDIMLGSTLVDMYAKCGALVKAKYVFDQLLVRDIFTWNTLIAGYAQFGHVLMALESFQKMIEEDIIPDAVTFVVLLSTCSHAGLVELGEMYFEIMNIVYCMLPTIEHYTCMVDIFSRTAHFDKALFVIEKVPSSDCLPLWSVVLGGCKKWSNVDLGRHAFERMVELDKSNPVTYICMRNIYMQILSI